MISFWYGDTLLKGNFKNTKLLKYAEATGGQTDPFLPRKI